MCLKEKKLLFSPLKNDALANKSIYLIPTPLSDTAREGLLTPFSIEIIKSTHYYFVENLRTARRFVSSLKAGIVIDSLKLFELTKDTSEYDIKQMLKDIPTEVVQIGVMSEAGCPGIADPGAKLVAIAHTLGWKVIPIPGPSSLFLALMGSGFNGQQFTFHGYLPIKQDERVKMIKRLEEESLKKGHTHLFIETPYRNTHMMQDLLSTLQGETQLCIASNLSSEHEILSTKKAKEWKNNIPEINKIPTIFLIGSTKQE